MKSTRRYRYGAVVLVLIFMAWLMVSCSTTRNLCPAYDINYKVEPLPY